MRTALIALVTGLVGGIAAFFGGEIATRAHQVSDFEGGRGMLLVFVIAPAGFIVAAVIGAVVAIKFPGAGFSGFLKAQGIAVGTSLALAVLVFGWFTWKAPRVPQLDGQYLSLDFEVRMPPGRTLPAADDQFSVLMTSQGSGDDRRLAELQLDRAGTSEGRVVFPATAEILTSTPARFLVINDTGGRHFWFDLPLAARPRAADLEWTDWWPAPGQTATRDVNGNGGFQIRYRVRKQVPESTE